MTSKVADRLDLGGADVPFGIMELVAVGVIREWHDEDGYVTAVVTLDKADLSERCGLTPLALLREIYRGIRTSLDL